MDLGVSFPTPVITGGTRDHGYSLWDRRLWRDGALARAAVAEDGWGEGDGAVRHPSRSAEGVPGEVLPRGQNVPEPIRDAGPRAGAAGRGAAGDATHAALSAGEGMPGGRAARYVREADGDQQRAGVRP